MSSPGQGALWEPRPRFLSGTSLQRCHRSWPDVPTTSVVTGFGHGRGCFGREGVQSCTGSFPDRRRRIGEHLQALIATRHKAVAADALPVGGTLPVKKSDVIEFDTELLREETSTRYGEGLSIKAALRRQCIGHAQALLLMLPTLAGCSRDPQLRGRGGGFNAALEGG